MAIIPKAPPLQHDWVRWTVRAVAVIVDPFTGASTAVDVPSSAVGEQVGCSACGEPLTDSEATRPCMGDDSP